MYWSLRHWKKNIQQSSLCLHLTARISPYRFYIIQIPITPRQVISVSFARTFSLLSVRLYVASVCCNGHYRFCGYFSFHLWPCSWGAGHKWAQFQYCEQRAFFIYAFHVPSYLLIFRKRVRSHVNSEMSLVLRTIHYILELQPGDHSSEKSVNLVD